MENGETREDLSNQEVEITDNDPNYSAVTSLKDAQCFTPGHNEVKRKKKSYASDYWDGSHSATVMKKIFTNGASNYEQIDLTPCDVSVQKETQMQRGSETWDPSHIYSAVNKKSTKTAVKKTAVKSTHDNCLIYAVVDKKKPKVPPRSSDHGELDALESNDPGNEMYSNVVKKRPQLKLNDPVSDTCDPNYSVIDKIKKSQNFKSQIIFRTLQKKSLLSKKRKEAPEIPPFDLSMMIVLSHDV